MTMGLTYSSMLFCAEKVAVAEGLRLEWSTVISNYHRDSRLVHFMQVKTFSPAVKRL